MSVYQHAGFWITRLFLIGLTVFSALAQKPVAGDVGKPQVLVVASDIALSRRNALLRVAHDFYVFWNTGDAPTLSRVISPSFIDRDLPPGRPQGPTGPLWAIRRFKAAVPDLSCEVLQQIVAGDRVVSHLRFKGHFTGGFGTIKGAGQSVDFVATDILRIDSDDRIVDNWHIEDNLEFLKQIGAVP